MTGFSSPEILYEDEAILAVNKPAGFSVIHDNHRPDTATLVEILSAQFGRLWIVHRLDRETSGVLLFARTEQAHQRLNSQFQSRAVKKTYHLLACGVFVWQSIEVTTSLRVNGDRLHRTIVDLNAGKSAQTNFFIQEAFTRQIFLIKANPLSGYTHQIRVHLSSLNGCILYDRLYKPHPFPPQSAEPFEPKDSMEWISRNLPIRRLALHASEITFLHPLHNDTQRICARFSQDFEASLAMLKTTDQA